MRKKKYKLKRKVKRFFVIVLLAIIIVVAIYLFTPKTLKIIEINYLDYVEVIDDKININLKNNENKEVYCLVDNNIPLIDDINWIKEVDNKCILDYDKDKHYVYIKVDNDIKTYDSKMYFSELKGENKIYLANNDTYYLFNYLIGTNKYSFKYDESIISIDKYGVITPLKKGSTTLLIDNNDEKSIDVVVTDFITKLPDADNLNKKINLTCNLFSNDDNALLDEILKYRISSKGYKTRAGVVEAARFLSLEFPYKISYFYENGRFTTNGIDGEGRYYHKGLYLSESKYSSIAKSSSKPKIWGCPLYSSPSKRETTSGLDCSGFVSWVILNGGFNVGDLGAGWSNRKNLTDIGDLKKFNTSLFEQNKIKVGDLLHAEEGTGHIGIIIGIDEENYYVAQSIWFNQKSVVVSTYKKSNISKDWWTHVVLMDKYYVNDGNLTDMWY